MSNEIRNNLLKIIETLENNSINLENKLFYLSSDESEIESYNKLIEEQRKLLSDIKDLDIKEEILDEKEEILIEREISLNKKEERIIEREKELIEEEIRIKEGLDKYQQRQRQKIIEERKNKIKNIVNNSLKNPNKTEPKKLYQDISNLGKILNEDMTYELKQNPDKFIDIKNEINSAESKYFPLAILSNNLQKEGIYVLIEKDSKSSTLQDVLFKFIFNGIINQKKIIMNYDLGPGENHMIINNDEYRKNFIDKEYDKLTDILKIKKEYINICNFDNDSVKYELFISEKFPEKDIDDEPLIITDSFFEKIINKLEQYSSSQNIKLNAKISPLLESIILNKNIFDSHYNKNSNWSQGATRGGLPYDPPLGWSGYGLNVLNKYENNDWLGNSDEDGEWCVAYYNTNIIKFGQAILKYKDLPSKLEAHQGCNNKNKKCENEKVGIGVYVTSKIKIAEECTSENDNYKCIFMCRINPNKFRTCDFDYFVVDLNDNNIRPYKLLIKKCS